MHPQAEALAEAWIGHFWAANHDIHWTAIEQEVEVWLDDRTVLIGKKDAAGTTSDGRSFFGEWKSLSAQRRSRMAEVKLLWRTNPQALTYGLLSPETRRFTVRWALKTSPPVCDFEWYTYTDAEMAFWRGELLNIADDIRRLRAKGGKIGVWPTNFNNCFKYGVAYACPLYDAACSQLSFSVVPPDMQKRQPHTSLEKLYAEKELPQDVVVLSSSRVDNWLTCNEKYRRLWEGDGLHEDGEALQIGTDFHALVAAHLKTLVVVPTLGREEQSVQI